MKPAFYTDSPLVRPHVDGEDLWTFHEPVGLMDSKGVDWWTPSHFTSDGASIPGPLQRFWGHPFHSDYIRPAALHDYYYSRWPGMFDNGPLEKKMRRIVDGMFYDALIADGVGRGRAWSMYLGVRLGGWVPWNRRANLKLWSGR